ncbi:MAG: glycosyltransferase [Planctomycetes bacterium]|nr:glycosyltransferase [Planctomycetota bacterium]
MVRVAFLVYDLDGPGGMQRQAVRLAGRLRERGVVPTFVSTAAPRDLPSRAGRPVPGLPGVGLLRVPTTRAPLFEAAARAFLAARGGVDVLYAVGWNAALHAARLGERLGAPVVVKYACAGAHGDFAWVARTPGALALLQRAARHVCLSGALRDEALAAGLPGPRLVTIPNGVDADAWQADVVPAALPWPSGRTVLFLGRLAVQKRVDVLLDAFARLGGDARLALAGDGPLRRALEERARDLGLGGRVAFLGQREDVLALHRAARVVVLPSEGEGLSNVLLEALASGTPVVATDVPGTREVVTPEVEALLVPPNDPAALAAALGRVLDDPDLAAGGGPGGAAGGGAGAGAAIAPEAEAGAEGEAGAEAGAEGEAGAGAGAGSGAAGVAGAGRATGAASPDRLRRALAARLPAWMVPQRLERRAALPRAASGKVDRRALLAERRPAPDAAAAGEALPEQVRAAMSAVVGQPVGLDDDFFARGGDSLRALALFARLAERLARLPRPGVVYEHRTPRALAARLAAEGEAQGAAEAPAADDDGPFPLSAAQRGFLLARALDPAAPDAWCAAFELRGPLTPARLDAALAHLLARHPQLRARVDAGATPPVQRVQPLAALRLEARWEPPGADLDALLAEERARRFALDGWPLVHLRVAPRGADRHALVVSAHHLLADGLSGWLLVGELLAVLEALERGRPPALPPLRATFREAVALAARAEADPGRAAFWRRAFAASLRPPPLAPGGAWVRAARRLAPGVLAALRRAAGAAGVTVFARALAALAAVLGGRLGEREVVVGAAVTGRDLPLPDVLRLFGCFAHLVPVRLATDGDARAAHAALAGAVAHALPPEAIARAAGLDLRACLRVLVTFLDLEAVPPPGAAEGRLRLDAARTRLDPPRGVCALQVVLRAEPGAGLWLGLTGAAAAFDAGALEALADGLVAALDPAPPLETSPLPLAPRGLDAALIGYLPPRAEVARLAPPARVLELLFPGGAPAWLEELTTPLGRSGLLCLPRFADDLAPGEALAGEVARAVARAGRAGARCVSLAGMLPAATGYGCEVAARLAPGAPELTTGHALTAVAVVETAGALLAALGEALPGRRVAVVGLGSIGQAALALLLETHGAPRRLVLCDPRPEARAAARALLPAGLEVEEAPAVGAAVYAADLLIGATSAARVLEVARLRPGAVVADDSFPPCLDEGEARARMQGAGDVLIVGAAGRPPPGVPRRRLHLPPALGPAAGAVASALPAAGAASCQLEALLRAARPGLPPVRGLVAPDLARAYQAAARAAGLAPAALHLGGWRVPPAVVARVRALRGGVPAGD